MFSDRQASIVVSLRCSSVSSLFSVVATNKIKTKGEEKTTRRHPSQFSGEIATLAGVFLRVARSNRFTERERKNTHSASLFFCLLSLLLMIGCCIDHCCCFVYYILRLPLNISQMNSLPMWSSDGRDSFSFLLSLLRSLARVLFFVSSRRARADLSIGRSVRRAGYLPRVKRKGIRTHRCVYRSHFFFSLSISPCLNLQMWGC